MLKRAIGIALLVLLAGGGFALLPSTQQSKPNYQEQPAKAETRNDVQRQAVAQPAAKQSDKGRKGEGNWYDTFFEHTAEWLIALFTLVLSFYTGRLFYATAGLRDFAEEQSRDMKSSIAVAEKTARAAELNAQVLVNSERANIVVAPPEIKFANAKDSGYRPRVIWKLHNWGRTPGTIKEFRGEISFVNPKVIPNEPTFIYSKIRRVEILVARDDFYELSAIELNRDITRDEYNSFAAKAEMILFFGYIKYSDTFRFLHTKGFGIVLVRDEKPRLIRRAEYNYTKSEALPDDYVS